MHIEAGQQILHYRVIEKIGEGGMGVVWRAQDTRLHRHVALKFVPEEKATDLLAMERHLREARVASALNHPNICSIYDIGEWSGRQFIAMELLEGRTLQDMIAGRSLEIRTAIDLACQMADALTAAHAKGIIHRDIKPANVFVVGDSPATYRAKILDFGLAKLATGQASEVGDDKATQTALAMTMPGSVMGTVSYMSPEQALGKDLDHRTDVFSLGVVLYEMVTGHRAFAGDTSAAVFDAILNRSPTAPVELNLEIPAALERILNKALEKDAALRYQNTASLSTDLTSLLRDLSTRHTTASESGVPRVLRRYWPWLSGILIALLLAGVGLRTQRGATQPASAGGQDALSQAVQSSSNGPSIAVLSFINESGDPGQDYFSGGLTDDIITELSKYKELFVVARSSTVGLEGSAKADEIGVALKVRYVLQGRVQRADNRVRLTVQLSDAREGRLIWGETYQVDLTAGDLFELQDELTQQVVNAIAGSYGVLSQSELAEARRRPPASLDSYDCVLRTYEYLHVHDDATHSMARDCLEHAVERDPNYADGWAWLSYLYGEEYRHRRNERSQEYDPLDRAMEAAENAVRLEPESQVSQGAIGLTSLLRGELERGRAASMRAIELNPNNALWLGILGSWLSVRGDFEHGVPMTEKAIALNPNPPPWLRMPIYLEQYHAGRYDAAAETALIVETADFRTPLFRAAAYGQLGRRADAERYLDELLASWPRPVEEIRQELDGRNGFTPDLTDHLLEGLEKAGLDLKLRGTSEGK